SVLDPESGKAAACTLEVVQRAVVLALVERQASEVLLDFGLGHFEAALPRPRERLLVQAGGVAEAVLHREHDGDVVFDLCQLPLVADLEESGPGGLQKAFSVAVLVATQMDCSQVLLDLAGRKLVAHLDEDLARTDAATYRF